MSRPATAVASSLCVLPKQPLVDVLLTNLRLLDLDVREDWPEISQKLFSVKDTQQNQKQRIKCTEWILYRLFELWDPEETRDKLQPFFPPLEPLQSLNLRSALFRSLNELKKNGALGRELVLRKTMLDECKGEKFLELLTIFSTAVLRRNSTSKHAYTPSVSYRICTAPMLNAVQQGSLLPLAVAHTVSLTNMLKRREERSQRYVEFNELLDGKRAQLRQRVKASMQSKRRESNVNEEAQIKKIIHDSWAGHSKWPQALLAGDDVNAGDLPLQRPFQEVWPIVCEGGQLLSDSSSLGLLATLDKRVQMQKERLQMWQEFHENIRGYEDGQSQAKGRETNTMPDFKFERHQVLRLGLEHHIDDHKQQSVSNDNAYKDVLASMSQDLAKASQSRRKGGDGWASVRDGESEYRSHDLFSPVKSTASEKGPNTRPSETASSKVDIMHNLPFLHAVTARSQLRGFNIQRLGSNDRKAASDDASTHQTTLTTESQSQNHVPVRASTPDVETPIKITPESPTVEETAADRIISSVVDATPSPAKHMSLTERTRMSMAYFDGARNEPQSVDSGIVMPQMETDSGDDEDTIQAKVPNRRISLLERTRLSMAQVPAQTMQSRKAAKRQSRQSLFPVNQFETPGRPRSLLEPVRDTTPTEKLFSDEAEYASVFKSRPRIALSPVISPDGPSSFSGIDDSVNLDLDEDLEDADSSDTPGGFGSSPLAARRKLITGNNG